MLLKENNQIAVTGIGLISPFGIGLNPFLEGTRQGKSAIQKVEKFKIKDWCGSRLSAGVPEFALEDLTGNPKDAKRASPMFRLAWAAAHQALQDSELQFKDHLSERTGIFVGSSRFLIEQLEHHLSLIYSGRLKELLPFRVEQFHPHGPAVHLGYLYNLFGPTITFSGACLSAIQALEASLVFLMNGIIDVALVVSSDVLSSFQFHSEAASGILSQEARPGNAPRPFDREADGCVLSEGAVAFVLEREPDSRERGKNPHAMISALESAATPCPFPPDISNIPDMDWAMKKVLNNAGTAEIDLIHAQGRGIRNMDLAELRSIRKAWGSSIDQIPITSIQGSVGHAGGTSAFLQMVSAIMSIEMSFIPPIVNLREPAEGCDLNLVKGKAIIAEVNKAMVFCPGWGGQHSAVLLTR